MRVFEMVYLFECMSEVCVIFSSSEDTLLCDSARSGKKAVLKWSM